MRKNMRFGYEVEFFTNRSEHRVIADLQSLGIDASEQQRDNYDWYLHQDGSLSTRTYGYRGLELSSAIMSVRKGLMTINKIFDNMMANNDETNHTSGFHTNLSFEDKALTKQINQTVLVFLLDEDKVLEKFGRTQCGYCRPHRNKLRESINHDLVYGDLAKAGVTFDYVGARLSTEKYRFANLGKLTYDTPYIEFRGIGGDDYHKRFPEIRETVYHFMDCMKRSVNPDAVTKSRAVENFVEWKKKSGFATA